MKLIDILDGTSFPVAYRIAFITNFWREPLLRRMERETGLIRPELTVLLCLSFRGGLHARDICEITEQPSNTISRAVNSLEAKGMITRQPDETDQRRILLDITGKGQALHDELTAMFQRAEKVMLASLNEAETATLTALLDRIARDAPDWSNAPEVRSDRRGKPQR